MKRKIKNQLKSIIGTSNVLTSKAELEAYASDASIYKAYPLAIVTPETYRQLRSTVNVLRQNGLPITPRGGGSGLAGGAVSEHVIIDFSKLNRVLSCDIHGRTVNVECGIVYDRLNRYLAGKGLFFPPDPSSGDTCQIGGMLGNNSSGARSVKYGTTRKYVEELHIILPDGRDMIARDLKVDSKELERFFSEYPEFENIYRIISGNRDEILRAYPNLRKNVCGYDLKTMADKLDQGIFAVPQLFIGSEGTLGLFVSAKLRLLPLPKDKLTSLILFEKLDQVGDATLDFLNLEPAGLELIDGNTLDLIGRQRFELPPSAEAMLIVEFDDPPYDEKVAGLKEYLKKYELSSDPLFETDPKKQSALWGARKAIVPTLYRLDENARPWGFIEDAAIPSEKMPDFIRFLNGLFEENGLTCGIFGHIGDGNLHVRPAVNLASEGGQKLARSLFDRVYDKIFELGGSATAEHGDGHLRAEVIHKMYGDKIYDLFMRIKNQLDPDSKLNPEVLLSKRDFLQNVDVEKVVRECAACGKCNNYCPSFEVHKSENMAARGWVRVMLSEKFNRRDAARELDGCLNCKSCYIVCPAGVDVSRYVTQRRHEHPTFWGRRIFGLMRNQKRFENLAGFNGRILRLFDNKAMRPLLEMGSAPFAKVDRKRLLPKFAKKTLRQKYSHLIGDNGGEVAYFYGCADNLLESNTGSSLINVLEKHGFKVSLPEQKCCGMPQQTYGFFDYEKENAVYNLQSLDRYKYIVFSCATCLGQVLSYPHLFKEGDRFYDTAKSVASKCFDISEFILRFVDLKFSGNGLPSRRITFHQPCHLRESGRQDQAEELLKKLPGMQYLPMEDADFCCGSAGTYNIFHYENSMKIFDRKKQAVEKINPDLILTNCPTCILQFQDGLKSRRIARHSVELINRLCVVDE
jgi:FAD/FMN-containing dehydrogenase/Fe-S oxidoreductase